MRLFSSINLRNEATKFRFISENRRWLYSEPQSAGLIADVFAGKCRRGSTSRLAPLPDLQLRAIKMSDLER